jgi:hypothetical protein
VKLEPLHNQLELQAFIGVISIFKPIDYLCQFLFLPLLISSINCLHNIIIESRSFGEEELNQGAV